VACSLRVCMFKDMFDIHNLVWDRPPSRLSLSCFTDLGTRRTHTGSLSLIVWIYNLTVTLRALLCARLLIWSYLSDTYCVTLSCVFFFFIFHYGSVFLALFTGSPARWPYRRESGRRSVRTPRWRGPPWTSETRTRVTVICRWVSR